MSKEKVSLRWWQSQLEWTKRQKGRQLRVETLPDTSVNLTSSKTFKETDHEKKQNCYKAGKIRPQQQRSAMWELEQDA